MTLVARDIHVSYGPITAVQGVDIEVGPGRCVALVGANGAGKSSLLAGLIGTVPLTSGVVSLDDRDITPWAPHSRVQAGISLVPEGRGVLSRLTVEENLQLGGFGRKGRRDVQELYAMFPRLHERRALSAGNLSGGEQQMLALARAMRGRPSVLLLDEPSLGLAPLIVAEIYETIGGLLSEGLGIVLVEERTSLAVQAATHVLVLSGGRVAYSADTDSYDEVRAEAAYFGRATPGGNSS